MYENDQPMWRAITLFVVFVIGQTLIGIWWAASLSTEVRLAEATANESRVHVKEDTKDYRLANEARLQRMEERINLLESRK